jgi:hypothetical protein
MESADPPFSPLPLSASHSLSLSPVKREVVRDPAAVMKLAGSADALCRPWSARYAVKGYPNYAEGDECCTPPRKNRGGGGRAKSPSARCGRKRGARYSSLGDRQGSSADPAG